MINPARTAAALAAGFFIPFAVSSPAARAATLAAESLDAITIIAPSASGGGYDLTAQAMQRTLESTGIARNVTIIRNPGAGGLLGLTELVTAHSGNGGVLLIGGMAMLGATTSNRAAISLLDATPIARLTGEYDVIAVPLASPYRTLDDLLEAMSRTPGAVRWVGGSAGGTDERLMWQLARAAGVDPRLMPYTALPGGSEIVTELLSGQFTVGISGIIELQKLIEQGRLRGLAISSPRRLPRVNIPTFDELGVVGLSLVNWRGVLAPPNISNADSYRLEAAIGRMVNSAQWRAELEHHHWEDAHLGSTAFREFIAAKQRAGHAGSLADETPGPRILPSTLLRRFMWTFMSALAAIALLVVLYIQHARGSRREDALRRALHEVSQEAARRASEMQGMLAGVSSFIEREFDRWGLTAAERAVAHLMLKGLRLKNIAVLRNTSGRTVRQQAQAIYRKARLEGRSDLAAYFLEEFLAPTEAHGGARGGMPALAVHSSGGSARGLNPTA